MLSWGGREAEAAQGMGNMDEGRGIAGKGLGCNTP